MLGGEAGGVLEEVHEQGDVADGGSEGRPPRPPSRPGQHVLGHHPRREVEHLCRQAQHLRRG
eukprot:8408904-Pyramimonas_sp.AAC.1